MSRWLQVLAMLPAAVGILCALGSDVRERIRTAQSSGDFERAAGLYRELIASGEDTPEARSNLAAMLHLGGHDFEAVAEARIALKAAPNLAGPNLIAGLALSRLGRPGEAIPYLERAHRQDPHGIAPLIALGQAYAGVRDYSRSNAAYLEASKVAPDNAEAWFGLGITYRSLADAAIKRSPVGTVPPQAERLLESALAALTKAVTLQPEDMRTHLILAESYRDSDRFTEAVNEYRIVLERRPEDLAAELGLATTYWKEGQADDAIPQLDAVLRKLPSDPEANGIMAEILVKWGDFKNAEPYAIQALKGNPTLLHVRFALAKIYLDANRTEPAIAELKKAAPADPDGSYHYLLHRALKAAGRDKEAAAALEEFKRRRHASSGGHSE